MGDRTLMVRAEFADKGKAAKGKAAKKRRRERD